MISFKFLRNILEGFGGHPEGIFGLKFCLTTTPKLGFMVTFLGIKSHTKPSIQYYCTV